MEPRVQALFVTRRKKAAPVRLEEVQLSAQGFEGDFHAEMANSRQILMVSGSVLEDLGVTPGSLSENIVIDNLDVMTLEKGRRLSIGDAVLEVTIPCEPCIQMERIRKGLQVALNGKRGMFAKVFTSGTIRVGDRVTL
jgi:MOSC domain-containing protein YiiM